MKDISSDNLAKFIGLCISEKDHIIAIWELCRQGSLADIIPNIEIKLDATFKGSIARDIVMGLEYLHNSPVGVHGGLCSRNCLVDGRWSVKLSDFGLPEILRQDRLDGLVQFPPFSAEKLIHIAPELRVSWTPELGLGVHPTVAGDVFGLGVILFQILTREPLFDPRLTPEADVIRELVAGTRGPPTLPGRSAEEEDSEIQESLIPLMRECWATEANRRPSLPHIRRVVKSVAPSGANLVEHMMSVMEKYATNLEEVVQSRMQERRQAEALLARMLPKTVAKQLQKGELVVPETFKNCTIYFSDIVGFTNISSRSEPLEVETIGDSYMVVSGIPVRNGRQHVVQIASLALAIREAVSAMRVPHIPSEALVIRIGMHSGPCAAGVVGDTMPRYCLFGDTVNTASRMESTAMKIQISESTEQLLKKASNRKFTTTFRGQISVKGKGDMSTFWLDKFIATPRSPSITSTKHATVFAAV